MSGTWVVLIEAAGDPANGPIDLHAVERLRDAMGSGTEAGALHCADRYALQVTTTSPGPVEALYSVLSRCSNAVRRLKLPVWNVVRTEVLTPEELARDFQHHGHDSVPESPASSPAGPGDDDVGHELVRRAFSDPLTGLLSREAIEHRVEWALARSGTGVAAVCLDIDGFRSLNDRLGEAAGDHVLVAVARRLASRLRPGDDLARLGGDEFAVLLDDKTEEAAGVVADRLLDAIRRPLDIEGREVVLSASVGIASGYPGARPRQLIENAAAALSLARQRGGNRHVIFGPAMAGPAHPGSNVRADALRDHLAHLLLVQEAAIATNAARTLEEAAEVVLRQVCAHIGCAVGHLWISTPDRPGQLVSTPLWHIADGGGTVFRYATDTLSLGPGAGLAGRVLTSGRPVWIPEIAVDHTFDRRQEAAADGLESGFAFPVLVGHEVVAMLEFFSRTRMEPIGSFSDVMSNIGSQLGRVVERQRAHCALHLSDQRLRESEARLRKAQALAGVGSWQFDLRTGEAIWSDEMLAIFGLDSTASGLSFEAAMARVHPADRGRAQSALTRLVESGERVHQDVRIVRPDGQLRWHRCEASADRDENGVVVAIHGTSRDITAEKQVADELRVSQEFYKRIVETTHEGIFMIDAGDNVTFANPRMAQILGYSVEEMPGMPASVFVHEETRAAMSGRRRRRRAGMSEHYENTFCTKEGDTVQALVSASPLFDEHDRYSGALAMVTDINALREAEAELRSHDSPPQSVASDTNAATSRV
jgi:diguanylate cyclase (GGDEF)-like protein/PAS domain S-box-containing protein